MRNRRSSINCIALVACAAATLVAATAFAASANVSGKAGDRRGDAPRKGDIVRVAASYRSGGEVEIQITLSSRAAANAKGTLLGGFLSHWKRGKCQVETAGTGLAYDHRTREAASFFVARKGARVNEGGAQAKARGNVVTIKATSRRFARRGYDCAEFVTLPPTGSGQEKALDRSILRLR